MRERNIKLCKVNKAKQNDITIHSKHFSVSGWPYQTDDVKGAEKLQISEHLSRKPKEEVELFWYWEQKKRSFHSFHQEELGKLLGKKIARTGRRQIEGRHLLLIIWRIFAKPNNPLAPKLDIDGGKHVLACF